MNKIPPPEALHLAAHGIPSFPCLPNKSPATSHGFKDAVSNEAALREFWRNYPGELIGVPTGPASGFDVLDIDPRHGGDDWLADHVSYLPQTRTHQTRSGGVHFYFKHRAGMRNSESRIAPGVDVRGEGGYVIWWPGFGGRVLNHSSLADWPDWLAALALRRNPGPNPIPTEQALLPRPARANSKQAAALILIGNALYSVETAPEGQKHNRLRAAARTIGGLIDEAGISAADAQAVLLQAVQRAGAKDMRAAANTAAWGLENGRKAPLKIGVRR